MILAAKDVNLIHFNPDHVSYEPKGIHTEAIHVTIENVGKLSLEFESELEVRTEVPLFVFTAERGTDEEPCMPRRLTVRVGDWIVPLRGELHVYTDTCFGYTFSPDDGNFESTSGLTIGELREELNASYMSPDFAPGGRGNETAVANRDA